MSNISNFVKRIRDVMRQDPGINGDAQRIEQIAAHGGQITLFQRPVHPVKTGAFLRCTGVKQLISLFGRHGKARLHSRDSRYQLRRLRLFYGVLLQ